MLHYLFLQLVVTNQPFAHQWLTFFPVSHSFASLVVYALMYICLTLPTLLINSPGKSTATPTWSTGKRVHSWSSYFCKRCDAILFFPQCIFYVSSVVCSIDNKGDMNLNKSWYYFVLRNFRRTEGKKEKRAEERQRIQDKIPSRWGKTIPWKFVWVVIDFVITPTRINMSQRKINAKSNTKYVSTWTGLIWTSFMV